jgi:exonuclease SbcD
MRILHTADWHVGKTIRGHSRAEEHVAVLDEIAGVAREREVDLVIVAGDLFDSASPTAESEQVVYRALLALRGAGATVVVIAGNHDNPNRLHAVAPLFGELDVRVVAQPSRPDAGGVIDLRTLRGGEARLAMLPFVSQRSIVRADQLMARDGADNALAYAERYRRLTDVLTEGLGSDRVNLVVAHAFVANGMLGGGERSAHTVFDYSVPATVFPAAVQYVALGHLHRAQRMDGATQIHYPGSPLQLDFGEVADVKQVNLVEVEPGRPARVEAVPLQRGRRLRTVRGSLIELRLQSGDVDSLDYVRVVVTEPARAGLADEVRAMFPGAIDVVVERAEGRGAGHDRPRRQGLTPHELFAAFSAERGHDDARVQALFAELLEDSGAAASG